jgi:hypothetical protein
MRERKGQFRKIGACRRQGPVLRPLPPERYPVNLTVNAQIGDCIPDHREELRMARKRTLNRMDYRGDFDGEEGEAKPAEEEETDEEEEGEEEEEAEAEGAEPDEEPSDEEEAPKPVKKPKKKAAAPKRVRTPKVVRKKAVWVIYDNSSKEVETYEYSQRAEAEALVLQKNTDKKGACYLQLVKVPLEEKEKEEEKKEKKEK